MSYDISPSLSDLSHFACMPSSFSHVQCCATLWTAARQAPLSPGFSRQEYWSGLPFPPPGDLPQPGIEPESLASNLHWQVNSLPLKLHFTHPLKNDPDVSRRLSHLWTQLQEIVVIPREHFLQRWAQ